MVGGSLRGTATAAEIRALVDGALASYPTLGRKYARVLLFEQEGRLLPRFDAAMGAAARRRLARLGVEVFTGTRVAAVTPDEVVLASGERIPCRTVVGAASTRPHPIARLPSARADGRLPVDEFLRVRGMDDVVAAGDCAATSAAVPFQARREIAMGRRAAFNVLALLRGYPLQPWTESKAWLSLAPLGRHATVARAGAIHFGGIPAWVVSRLLCLLTLPGLERNLRVLVDWVLDVPFRNDIVVLAPQRTQKLSRAHYECGDVIVRQGDRGECAYLLTAGEVEVLREVDGRSARVRTMQAGDCFGEIALLADTPRTATVRCLTPVDVVVLARDQLVALAEGYREFGNALRSRMTERLLIDRPGAPQEAAHRV